MRSIMWMCAYIHNYQTEVYVEWHTYSEMGTHVAAHVHIHGYIEIYCHRSDAVDRIGCRCYLSSTNAVRHILPTSHRNPLFPFMLLVTLLLFGLQSLIGELHTLKCFPHACRIFIQMCEQGQGSCWAQLPSVYSVLGELSVSKRHLGSSKGGAHGDSFSADLENVNRQGIQMIFTNADNVN